MSAPAFVPEAALPEASDLASQNRQFVTFCIANEMFAVPMAPVQEIIRVPDVARMPLTPPALDGLSNLRGRVLPIINLRRLFNITERSHDDATRALVINLGQSLGFVVDRVASVISVDASEIEAADTIQSIVQTDYLTGVIKRPTGTHGEEQLLLILDFAQLVQRHFAHLTHTPERAGNRDRSGPSSEAPTRAVPTEATNDELRLVSFTVAGQEYALDIADVQEIVQVPTTITAVPNTPAHVLGLMSLRQRLLPLVSLRTLFALAPAELDEFHRIVVVTVPGGGAIGLVTDSVKEVLSVPRSQADAMPGLLARDPKLQEFSSICRLDNGRRLVSVIASDKLLGLSAIREALQVSSRHASPSHTHPTLATPSTANARSLDMASSHASADHAASLDEDIQVVIFRLGAEEFGVPIMSVQEIVRVPDTLTRVPKTPAFIEGVINLRGTVLPVIDQRTRLGMSAIERNDRQRIMVYNFGGLRTGFIVDSVAEVLRISRQHIDPAPPLSDTQMSLIARIAKLDGDRRLVMLIDPSQLMAHRELHAVQDMVTQGSDFNAPVASATQRTAARTAQVHGTDTYPA